MTVTTTDVGYDDAKSYTLIGSSEDGLSLVRATKDTFPLDSCRQWVEQAADMLLQQWPRGGPLENYRHKIVHPYDQTVEYYGLPCCYLLIQNDKCIGHGRLAECFESSGGNAAAATFIMIDSTVRGCGMGSRLMDWLEKEAERLGYHFVYLWTKTAIEFYEKIGYQQCIRVSLKRACLKSLEANQVQSLENLLLKKSQLAAAGATGKRKQTAAINQHAKETVLLPPGDDDNNLPDVWLRKRLVEHVGSIHIPLDDRRKEMLEVIEDKSLGEHNLWNYHLTDLPWQGQIGPSCGLAALRMVREYYYSQDSHDTPAQLPSLLGEAQERSYTKDGEVFNASHLKDLAENVCDLDSRMYSISQLSPIQITKELTNGSVWILPYDSQVRTRLPDRLSGHHAHYGIIVGVLVGRNSTEHANDLHPLQRDWEDTILNNDVYLMLQHSLSPKLAIAPWSDFVESNQQLNTVDEARFGTPDLDLKDRIILCRGIRGSNNGQGQ